MNRPLRILLVGPVPPPAGGMANQTRQFKRLLENEGHTVRLLSTNAPYRPAWVASLRGLRAVFRLLPYTGQLLSAAKHCDLVHVMANSGWAWHLLAAPAVLIAYARGTPVVVNYRGGLAREFLARRGHFVKWTLSRADALVVPSRFLQGIFSEHGMLAQIIPNVVDVDVFRPGARAASDPLQPPHIVVARNLEHVYGNDTAIRAFARLREHLPAAQMTIAGTGPQHGALEALVRQLRLTSAVRFAGALETEAMVLLYQSADVVLNPSRADNAPNSILEALACGIPVVSTDVGGVPFLVEHGRTAWLVKPDSPDEMAEGLLRVLQDSALCAGIVSNGLHAVSDYTWTTVYQQWLRLYRRLVEARSMRYGLVDRVR